MAKRRHTAEQIISNLREVVVPLVNGLKIPQVRRKIGGTERTNHRRLNGHPT